MHKLCAVLLFVSSLIGTTYSYANIYAEEEGRFNCEVKKANEVYVGSDAWINSLENVRQNSIVLLEYYLDDENISFYLIDFKGNTIGSFSDAALGYDGQFRRYSPMEKQLTTWVTRSIYSPMDKNYFSQISPDLIELRSEKAALVMRKYDDNWRAIYSRVDASSISQVNVYMVCDHVKDRWNSMIDILIENRN